MTPSLVSWMIPLGYELIIKNNIQNIIESVLCMKLMLPSFLDFPSGFKLVLPLSFQLFSSLFLRSFFSAPLKVFEGVEQPFPGVY